MQQRARAEWLRVGSTTAGTAQRATATILGASPVARPTAGGPGSAGIEASPIARTRVAYARMTSAVLLPVIATSGRDIGRGTVVARLVISAIDLDEIVMEGVGPVDLNGGPGHFPGSALPGEAGKAILSVHRDRHFRNSVSFASVAYSYGAAGQTVDWVITERRIVSRDTPALFGEPEATLTLTTCWPIRYFGPAPDRLLLVAKPAS